ncbi:hypothetical protein [Paenibacillus glycanilyticus]|uniref:Zinc ribbon domain-containing protein n=1 Tax=Paenibacillus glycanilyticus TaxID=126569 RepID=A0ABQ6GPH1_9BACL|nr:hypothetical protein [Paenibacillus glycanilyticus]GLX71373.1 hypothetical protein MU1_57230 [Paenibacillus glycanilyticus]
MAFILITLGIIVGGLIASWILYEVIQSAIDNSAMARNIKEIRDHLVGKPAEPSAADGGAEHGLCPGCGHRVHRTDRVCPGCALALKDWD